MPYLIALVVFTTVLGLVNLLLLIGVIRRLRAQADNATAPAHPRPLSDLTPGDPLPDFSAVTTGGVAVSRADVVDGIVAFFSTDCSACHDQLPQFLGYARGRAGVLAVVAGPAEQTPTMVASLSDVAGVVREPLRGPLGVAFGVSAYPVVLQFSGDRLAAVSIGVDTLPAPAAR